MAQTVFEVFQTIAAHAAALLAWGALYYIVGAVMYNVLLARKRRSRREKSEPPTARVEAIVYPDGREEVMK